MEPEKSSARPLRITIRVLPKDDRPAVRANGTVRPSEKPIIESRISVPWFLVGFPGAMESEELFDDGFSVGAAVDGGEEVCEGSS